MKKAFIFLPLLFSLFIASCGGGADPAKEDFSDVTFNDLTVTYDGQPHILDEVSGAPEGTEINYVGRDSYTDAGSYQATARLTKDGYNPKTLNAVLKINKANYGELTFANATVTYDGNNHFNDIQLVGELPESTTVTTTVKNSSGRTVTSAVDADTYSYTAKISNKNYVDKTLNATLVINPIPFADYQYASKTVTYDGEEHIGDIQLVGVLPEGTTTTETIKDSNGNKVTSAIEVGIYNYSITLSKKNYETETLTATLTIRAQKRDMPVFYSSDGNIYFSNGLHNNYLYSLNSSETKLIDYSAPKEFNKNNSSSLTFIAGSVFLNSVKQIDSGSVTSLYSKGNIDDFVKYSDKVYYYASNSLKAENSGIYKVDASNDEAEPVITKVFDGKSDNLAIYNGYLYFSNHNDYKYLYKMNLSTNEASLVMEEKVHEFIINNNKLYCTVNGLNDYIGYLDLSGLSTTPTKLTNNAGEFLTVKNGYLFYNYTDLFSVIEPENKGIWRINLSSGENTQVLAINSINGFDAENASSIVYVDTNDLHLYRYNIQNETRTDLLASFVPPESVPLNTGGHTVSVGTKTYYLNMYAGKTLYVYDETSKKNSQLTANKVQDFYIYNDKLYFNQVTLFTNNDLYVVDLTEGGEAEKISSNDIRELVSDGTYLYGCHYNFIGTAGGMARMKLDGSEYIKFSDINGAKNLTIRNGLLYFINCNGETDGNLEYITLSEITTGSSGMKGTKFSTYIKEVKQFIFESNNIYYIYNGAITKEIRRTDFTTRAEGTALVSEKTAPIEMVVKGGYIYYYSFPKSSLASAGFYRVSKTATVVDQMKELILATDSTYYGTSLSISNSYLYFLNYYFYAPTTYGDAHFYQIQLSDNSVSKIN